ncbi:hypothetical protein JTB14_006899 [Gonioctena quinquepunctata]|nr:hypothetical protein JTB14_006899 [Gonioctena quinquepunctata]
MMIPKKLLSDPQIDEESTKLTNLLKIEKKLACDECPKTFLDHIDLAYHSKKHSITNDYSCHLCSFAVNSKFRIRRHMQGHAGYQCQICNKIFKRSATAVKHSYIHSGKKPYLCNICGKHLANSKSLDTHLHTIHYELITGKPLVKYDCPICKKHYESETGLRRHYSSTHREMGVDLTVISAVCKQELKAAETKKRRTKTKANIAKEKENKIKNIFELDEPLQCVLCTQKFDDTLSFALHSKHHNVEGVYSCHFCDKKIPKKFYFERHVLTHNKYRCEQCKKTFKKKFTALNHTHSNEKLYQCTVCGKKLCSSWSLNTHLASVHRNDDDGKPLPRFQCSICDKCYIYESGLKLHYSSKHAELGVDYSVICDICGRRLSCKSKLKQHHRTHTGDKPYHCTVCSRRFATKDLVTSHMRIHTGEKPYVCMYCGKEFGQGAPYRYHLKTHTGEKSCSCPICGKEFISKGNMRSHVRSCNPPGGVTDLSIEKSKKIKVETIASDKLS